MHRKRCDESDQDRSLGARAQAAKRALAIVIRRAHRPYRRQRLKNRPAAAKLPSDSNASKQTAKDAAKNAADNRLHSFLVRTRQTRRQTTKKWSPAPQEARE